MLTHLYSALLVTAPVLLILLAGIGFKRIRLIDDNFVNSGSKLVFNVSLPCLLFLSVATRNLNEPLPLFLVGYAVLATLVSALLIFISTKSMPQDKRGVFVQCAFRGNMAIIGLALCVNAFGSQIISVAAIYVAILTILYNVVSVILLSHSYRGILTNLLKNPLIIAILLGGVWSGLHLPVPEVMSKFLGYLAGLTLPLALLCIGASLDWKSLQANRQDAIWACAIKLGIQPGIVVGIGYAIGITGQTLGVLFLMMATPTAAAAFVMSKQLSRHGNLAAEIITLSTAVSPITITVGLATLNMLGWV